MLVFVCECVCVWVCVCVRGFVCSRVFVSVRVSKGSGIVHTHPVAASLSIKSLCVLCVCIRSLSTNSIASYKPCEWWGHREVWYKVEVQLRFHNIPISIFCSWCLIQTKPLESINMIKWRCCLLEVLGGYDSASCGSTKPKKIHFSQSCNRSY